MNVSDAVGLAEKRALQLGWKDYDFEKKSYKIAQGEKKKISVAADEFFILLTPDIPDALFGNFFRQGIITSEKGCFLGVSLFGLTTNYTSNFEFAGSVTIRMDGGEGTNFVNLLRVFLKKD